MGLSPSKKTPGEVRPAATLIEVSGLVDPEMLVEIEVDAIIRS